MGRRGVSTIVLLFSSLLLTACSIVNLVGPSATQLISAPVTSQSGWTIILFMNGDGNGYAAQAFDDLNAMESVDLSGVPITVLALVDLGTAGGSITNAWSGARLYRVEYDPGGASSTTIASLRLGSAALGLTATGNDENVDMGDPNVLSSLLSFAKSSYPAQHYALVLWGSSDGWRNLGVDGTSGDPLYLTELGQAASGAGLDVIGFDMPAEALLELAFQLEIPQGSGHEYLIASEGATPSSPSWSLAGLLSSFKSSSMAPIDFVNAAVASYGSAQASTPEATISAVDLSMIAPVASALNTFASTLIGAVNASTQSTIQQGILNNVQSYRTSDDDLLDLVDLADYVSSGPPGGLGYDTMAGPALVSAVENAVVAEWNATSGGTASSHGLAVEYVPLSSGTAAPSLYDDGTGNISYYQGASVTHPLSFVASSTWVPGGTPSAPGPGGLLYYLWLKTTFP